MIQFDNVTKFFDEKKVLSNVNLKISNGIIYGIIGESGAGKSTLLRIMNGLETFQAGSVFFKGMNISEMDKLSRRDFIRKTAMVFQHFNLLNNKTIYQNIIEPLRIHKELTKEERHRRVIDAIQFVGLDGYEKMYPNMLSGGQKQRVGIARALALRPEVLLCDEATSALDSNTTHSIVDLLQRINKEYKMTIVFVTHQLEIARELCHQIVVMGKGRIIESGDTFTMFTNPKKQPTKHLIKHMLPQEDFDQSFFNDSQIICKLEFLGEKTTENVLFDIAFQYQIKVNIIGGQIQKIQGKQFGLLIIGFEIEDEKLFLRVKESFEEKGIRVTRLEPEGGQYA